MHTLTYIDHVAAVSQGAFSHENDAVLVTFRVDACGLENVVIVGEQGARLAGGEGARRLLQEDNVALPVHSAYYIGNLRSTTSG
jgi:hypothetical protein